MSFARRLSLCVVQVLGIGLLYVLSMVPLGLGRAQPTFSRLFYVAAIAAHILRLVMSVGLPQMRPVCVANMREWVRKIASTSDVHYVGVCVVALLLVRQPFFPLMTSPFLFALLRSASFAQKQVPALRPYAGKLLDNRVRAALGSRGRRTATGVSAHEVALRMIVTIRTLAVALSCAMHVAMMSCCAELTSYWRW